MFIVTITSLVFSLVEAQNRASHLPPHLRPLQPEGIETYDEPVKRVDITHVGVDMILSVTLPPSRQQVIDAQQLSRTTHLSRIVHDAIDNVNEQQNVNRRKEFNDRNLNNESDNNNNMLMLVREPVLTTEFIREREKQEIDKRNQLREPLRTSELNQGREYGNANSRNQDFEREPGSTVYHDNSFIVGNDFERERETEASNNYRQGSNRETEAKSYESNTNNPQTYRQEDGKEIFHQDLHVDTREEPQNREIIYPNNNNRREPVIEPVRKNEFNREREYKEENKLNQNFNRGTELKEVLSGRFSPVSDRGSDHYEIFNPELNVREFQKPNRDRSQDSEIIYESNNKNSDPHRISDFNYETIKHNNHDLRTVESREYSQNKENSYGNNNNLRRVVSEPARTSEFNREPEYEEENKLKKNFNRGTEIKDDRYASLIPTPNRRDDRRDVLNQNLGMMQMQQPNRDGSQNNEIFQGGNNKNKNIVSEPIRTSNSNQDKNYEMKIMKNINQGFVRESEKSRNRNTDSETNSRDTRNEAYDSNIPKTGTRERASNNPASYSGNNNNKKLVGEKTGASGYNEEREYEEREREYGETNKPNKGINRIPTRKLVQDSSFNSTPDRRVDRNDVIKQQPKNTERERPKVKENPQKAKANSKNQQGKTPRMCEKKYSEYIERIYRHDDETTADANDSEFDGRVLASPGEYPHMTALGFQREDKTIDYKCGGSLISENFVITAAHCTNFTGEVPSVARIGDINLMKDERQLEPQMYRIRKIYAHPEYDGFTHYNDIALLQLNASVEFTEFVRPIRLWSRSDLPLSIAFAMGYGATSFARAPTQQLTDFNMTIIANDECNERLPQLDEVPHGIIESLICAEDLVMHRDTCQGDSGGPLQYNIRGRRRKNRIHYQLIGITSFGLLCRSPNPGVYTRIYSFLDWIESKVWLN